MNGNEKNQFLSRMKDLSEKAYAKHTYAFSGFLSTGELADLKDSAGSLSFITYSVFGGYPEAERCMVAFGSPEEFGYDPTWPITVIKVKPLAPKFSDELTHRDFLGALMNLGIDRKVLGDIPVKNGKAAYVICSDSIADYICENLNRVKHTTVVCEIASGKDELSELGPELVPMGITVSSLRFDAVAAAVTKCSRSEMIRLFQSEKVTLNGRVCTENSKSLKDGDIFSVRGYGKFKFTGSFGETKKGRVKAEVLKYC